MLQRLIVKSAEYNQEKVPFYLGGAETDWGNRKCAGFVGVVSSQDELPTYMESGGCDPMQLLGGGVNFQILPVIKPISGGNKLSQPILV
jgi:hypothetical protein